jgi:hypothetical protein
LFLGIGATQVDRNSIADLDTEKRNMESLAGEFADAIKRVALTIANDGYESRDPPWPGTIYFEDISAESSFELIEVIFDAARKHGEISEKEH